MRIRRAQTAKIRSVAAQRISGLLPERRLHGAEEGGRGEEARKAGEKVEVRGEAGREEKRGDGAGKGNCRKAEDRPRKSAGNDGFVRRKGRCGKGNGKAEKDGAGWKAERAPGNGARRRGMARRRRKGLAGRLRGGRQSAGKERKEAERSLLCLKRHELFPPPLSPVGAELAGCGSPKRRKRGAFRRSRSDLPAD